MIVSIPTEKFLRIQTDEGQAVSGFSLCSVYNDCHRPTYDGANIVNFSSGVPIQKTVLDFDIRDKKEGLHVSKQDQVEVVDLPNAVSQFRQALKGLDGRFLKSVEGSLAQSLLREYLANMLEMEHKLAIGDVKGLAKLIGGFGERKSNRFVGYEMVAGQEYGLSDALLSPENTQGLVGACINVHVTSTDFETAYEALSGDSFKFWPVEQISKGQDQVRFFI